MYVETDLGRLDLLGETPIGNYAQLVTRAEPMQLGATTVKVIALDDLIESQRRLVNAEPEGVARPLPRQGNGVPVGQRQGDPVRLCGFTYPSESIPHRRLPLPPSW